MEQGAVELEALGVHPLQRQQPEMITHLVAVTVAGAQVAPTGVMLAEPEVREVNRAVAVAVAVLPLVALAATGEREE